MLAWYATALLVRGFVFNILLSDLVPAVVAKCKGEQSQHHDDDKDNQNDDDPYGH